LWFGHYPVSKIVEVFPKIEFIDIIGIFLYLQCKPTNSGRTFIQGKGDGIPGIAIFLIPQLVLAWVTAIIP